VGIRGGSPEIDDTPLGIAALGTEVDISIAVDVPIPITPVDSIGQEYRVTVYSGQERLTNRRVVSGAVRCQADRDRGRAVDGAAILITSRVELRNSECEQQEGRERTVKHAV